VVGNDFITAIAVNSTDNVYVSGHVEVQQGMFDLINAQFDAYGNMVWINSFGSTSTSSDFAYSNTLDEDENFIVTGTTRDINGQEQLITIKHTANGDVLWETAYGVPGINYSGKFVMCDQQGNVYVCAQGVSIQANSWFFVALKYDAYGNLLWDVRYAHESNIYNNLYSATIDVEGSIYMTGVTAASMPNNDFLSLKISTQGKLLWVRTYNSPENADDTPRKILISPNGNVYVSGASFGSGSIRFLTTIKYSQCPAMAQLKIQNQTPEETNTNHPIVHTLKNYSISITPNPYRQATQISYTLHKQSQVLMEVYAITGQKIHVLVHATQQSGTYSLSFSAQNLGFAPGLYLLRVKIDESIANYRLVELKN